jgi:hypothetical protein
MGVDKSTPGVNVGTDITDITDVKFSRDPGVMVVLV